MTGICPILSGSPTLLNRLKSIDLQGNPPGLFSLTNHVEDGLNPIGPNIPHPELTDLTLPEPGCEECKEDSIITFPLESPTIWDSKDSLNFLVRQEFTLSFQDLSSRQFMRLLLLLRGF